MKVESGVDLARFTTLGTGGRARAFARPESLADLQEVMRWAATEGLEVAVIGLGSNLLVADEGVDALVLKLAGDLAGARRSAGSSSRARYPARSAAACE
jgi:UDP-N-acetylmuramate dehydrogenase